MLSGAQNRKRKAEKEGDARKNASIFSNYLSKQELNNNFENIPSSMSSTHTAGDIASQILVESSGESSPPSPCVTLD